MVIQEEKDKSITLIDQQASQANEYHLSKVKEVLLVKIVNL